MKVKVTNFLGNVKLVLLGFVGGMILTSLVLNNRFGAMVKAFQNPDLINSSTFTVEVVKK